MAAHSPNTCWVVSDGRAGMENQALGLAEAIARQTPLDIQIKRIEAKSTFRSFFSHNPFNDIVSVRDENDIISDLDRPYPDIWIACGRRTLALSRWMKKRTDCFVVQTQDPRVPVDHFDMVIPPLHDALSGENVYSIIGSPNRLTDAKISSGHEAFAEMVTHLPTPRLAVLIGGDSKAHRLTPSILKNMLRHLRKLADAGYGLMVTTSRRTGSKNQHAITKALAHQNIFIWDAEKHRAIENPYFHMLGLADHILVTEESTNMITDAAYTGKPVHILPLKGEHPKFTRFHDTLRARNISRPFQYPLESWEYTPLRETDAAASAIITKWLGEYPLNTTPLVPSPTQTTYAPPKSAEERQDIMSDKHAKVLIIGSGAAGYTAAIYAARAMLEPVLVQGLQPGGQLTITTDVENYPGFENVIQGPWLMEQMQKQAEHVGTEMISDLIVDVDFTQRPFRMTGDSGKVYTADSVIIATGAQAKWMGLPSEEKFQGFGVSACATCDGFFYRGKHVAVVGGGNTAVEEALFLTNFAEKVTLIHRRDSLRAERILQNRLLNHKKIEVLWDTQVDEILGTEEPLGVTGIRLKNTKDGTLSELDVHGVFVAIGHAPATEVFLGKVETKPNGYMITAPDSTATNIPGVFAAGDVTDDIYRQAVTAAGMGCMAALEAEKFLAEQDG